MEVLPGSRFRLLCHVRIRYYSQRLCYFNSYSLDLPDFFLKHSDTVSYSFCFFCFCQFLILICFVLFLWILPDMLAQTNTATSSKTMPRTEFQARLVEAGLLSVLLKM